MRRMRKDPVGSLWLSYTFLWCVSSSLLGWRGREGNDCGWIRLCTFNPGQSPPHQHHSGFIHAFHIMVLAAVRWVRGYSIPKFRTHTHTHRRTPTNTHTQKYTHTLSGTHAHTHTHTHSKIHTYTLIHIHPLHTYTLKNTHIHSNSHRETRTHRFAM